jgi:hypothetical protein
MFLRKIIEQNTNNAKAGIVSIVIILSDQGLVRPFEKATASELSPAERRKNEPLPVFVGWRADGDAMERWPW